MDIKHVFEDSRIVMLEEDIARINEHCRYSDNEKLMMKYLLEERYRVLCHLTEYDDETKRFLVDFNDALRKACAELYHRTMAVYQECLQRVDYTLTLRHQSLREEKKENRTVILTFVVLRKD